jgi:hypothetical protein
MKGNLMRRREFVVAALMAAFMSTMSPGCGDGTDVKLATPETKIIEIRPAPIPTDRKKGGGITSRDSNRNPGASN